MARQSRTEDNGVRAEVWYGVQEFDDKIRQGNVSFEEEDDWIDWGDSIELLESLKIHRREVLSQLKKH